MARAPTSNVARRPAGITLLEVLISCGLLIVGLSAIAALLPAAGSQLTQATTEDRAAILLSNASADIFNRGLLSADSFPAAMPTSAALVFGRVLERLPDFGALPAGRSAGESFATLSAAARKRCGPERTFALEDAVVYEPTVYSATPTSTFLADTAGLGPRAYREGLCWGATLSSGTVAPAAGGKAVLSIVVFKRWSKSQSSSLDEAVPVVLKRVGSFYEADFVSSDSLLSGCSWLLAIPAAANGSPRWFRVMSSWSWGTGVGQTRRIVLRNQDDQDGFAALTGTGVSGATATVFAFDGIVRVDEKVVTLD